MDAHNLAKKYEIPFHIHMHETAQEITDSVEGNATQFKHNSSHNCRPLANFKRLGLIDKSLIAVHMTQVILRSLLPLFLEKRIQSTEHPRLLGNRSGDRRLRKPRSQCSPLPM